MGCVVAPFRTQWTSQSAPLLFHMLRINGRPCTWAELHSWALVLLAGPVDAPVRTHLIAFSDGAGRPSPW
eukprot:14823885-Alexandrium_andersonii.AAC.1